MRLKRSRAAFRLREDKPAAEMEECREASKHHQDGAERALQSSLESTREERSLVEHLSKESNSFLDWLVHGFRPMVLPELRLDSAMICSCFTSLVCPVATFDLCSSRLVMPVTRSFLVLLPSVQVVWRSVTELLLTPLFLSLGKSLSSVHARSTDT